AGAVVGAGLGASAGVLLSVGVRVGDVLVSPGSLVSTGGFVSVGLVSAGAGVFGACDQGMRMRGESSLKRSRKASSRKRRLRGTRSIRATLPFSVRWPDCSSRNVPSGLHESVLLKTFEKKLTCLHSPPLADATQMLRNDFPSGAQYAT